MRYAMLFSLVLLMSCSTQVLNERPLGYSYMPKYMDLDSVGEVFPATKEELIDSTFGDFKSISVLGGLVYNGYDTLEAPLGVLISEKKAAEYIYYEAEYQRQRIELKYAKHITKDYYDKSLEAEKLYQDEILKLQKSAKRSWFETNSPYIGFMAGILTAILTEIAIIKIAD